MPLQGLPISLFCGIVNTVSRYVAIRACLMVPSTFPTLLNPFSHLSLSVSNFSCKLTQIFFTLIFSFLNILFLFKIQFTILSSYVHVYALLSVCLSACLCVCMWKCAWVHCMGMGVRGQLQVSLTALFRTGTLLLFTAAYTRLIGPQSGNSFVSGAYLPVGAY